MGPLNPHTFCVAQQSPSPLCSAHSQLVLPSFSGNATDRYVVTSHELAQVSITRLSSLSLSNPNASILVPPFPLPLSSWEFRCIFSLRLRMTWAIAMGSIRFTDDLTWMQWLFTDAAVVSGSWATPCDPGRGGFGPLVQLPCPALACLPACLPVPPHAVAIRSALAPCKPH